MLTSPAKGNRVSLPVALVLILCASALSSSTVVSQERERPTLKNFGASLDKLKWDPQRNSAVETKPKEDRANVSGDVDVVKVETSLVACDVLVLDPRGQTVQGLTEKDFVLSEDGKPQQVGTFSLGDSAAVSRSIVLIIDYSSSQFPFINTSIAAATTLVDKIAPIDRMAIVTDDVELLQDFTNDKKMLKDKLESLRQRSPSWDPSHLSPRERFGRSAQYSALLATLREAFDEEDQRPIIIFQTDGDEAVHLRNPITVRQVPPNLPKDLRKEAERALSNWQKDPRNQQQREFSLNDVYRAVEKSRAIIYTVIPGFRLVGLGADEQMKNLEAERVRALLAEPPRMPNGFREVMLKREQDRWARTPPEARSYELGEELKIQAALAVVSTLTGGWTEFLEQPSQAEAIYSRIFSDINSRYIVGYYPTNKEHDGKRRKVNVLVRDHPEYTVIGRKAYYAPGPDQ
jgi:VWFA-related protein